MNHNPEIPTEVKPEFDSSSRVAEDFRYGAECVGEDADLFFPNGTTGEEARKTELAKEICKRCPVIEQCTDWWKNNKEEFGVWGGQDENERKVYYREMQMIGKKSGRNKAEDAA